MKPVPTMTAEEIRAALERGGGRAEALDQRIRRVFTVPPPGLRLLAALAVLLAPLSALAVDAVTLPATAPAAEDPLVGLLHLVVGLVRSGQWMQVGTFLTILVVLLLQRYGRQLLGQLPPDASGPVGALRSVLGFLFSTKPGGWLLNVGTTIAGALAAAGLAGVPVTLAMAIPIITGAAATAGIYGGLKDLWEWHQARKTAGELAASAAVGAAAGAAAAAPVTTPAKAATSMDDLASGR